jgi:hypothetical protein
VDVLSENMTEMVKAIEMLATKRVGEDVEA